MGTPAPAPAVTPEASIKAAAQVGFGAYQAAVAKEAPAEAEAEAESSEQPSGTPGRDEKGRFLPRSAKDESEDSQPPPQPKQKQPAAKAEAQPGKDAAPSSASDDRASEAETGEQPTPGSPRALLLKAKTPEEVDAAFIAAFGKPASAFNINSKQWVAMRHERRKSQEAIAAREAKLTEIASALQQKYQAVHEARALYEKGDVEGAFKLAFGESWNDGTKKALRQYHERDPRLEATQRELQELKQQLAERDQRAREQAERQQAETAMQSYRAQVAEAATTLSDPVVQWLGPRRAFQDAVLEWIQEHAYDLEGMSRDDVVATAASEIIDNPPHTLADLIEALRERAETGDRGATNHAAKPTGAALPVRQEAAPKRAAPKNLKQTDAAEVAHEQPLPPGPERDRVLRSKYERLLKQATPE